MLTGIKNDTKKVEEMTIRVHSKGDTFSIETDLEERKSRNSFIFK